MGSLFNVENPFFQAINKIIDIIVLSTIWSVLCALCAFSGYMIVSEGGQYLLFWAAFLVTLIPVGPATTGLYYAIVKVIRRERGYAFREFFRSFKNNFKQGAVLSLIIGVMTIILYVDYTWVKSYSGDNNKFSIAMTVIFNVITLIVVIMLVYLFPILSRFTLPVKMLFRNSFIMAIRHLPTTILLVLIVGVFGVGTYLLWPYPTFFLFPGVCAWLCSLLIERVFKKYMPKPEQSPEESGNDQWYLE